MGKFVKFSLVSYSEAKRFGKNQGNRNYNHAHLQKIKKQLLKSLDIIPAIIVNILTNHIIDGQHRLRAFIELIEAGLLSEDSKLKVMFVEIPVSEEKEAIIAANTNSKNWGLDDYMLSYAKDGIVPYVKLDEWCKMHALTNEDGRSKFRYGAAIVKGKPCSSILKSGDFNATDEEFANAEEVHAEMLEIVELFGLKGKGQWIECLAASWSSVRNQHEFKEWRAMMKRMKNSLAKLPKDNQKEWDNIFAQVHLRIDKLKLDR